MEVSQLAVSDKDVLAMPNIAVLSIEVFQKIGERLRYFFFDRNLSELCLACRAVILPVAEVVFSQRSPQHPP